MARLLAAVLLLAACAPRPVLKAPGVELFVTGPEGRRQWRLLVKFMPKDGFEDGAVLFDESRPGRLPPAAPLALTKKGFDADALPNAAYRLMTVNEGARGAVYQQSVETGEAYPLLWWGLGEDPGFDGRSAAENRTTLETLFPKKP
ncbi:MAG: hypothetical protein NUW21_02360 [Elusimicrobia bacterium]|nr:hypothetical protein [Elusimicrobiota bacterium]